MSSLESLFVNSYLAYLLHKTAGFGRLLELAGRECPRRLLEVGCGAGITTSILARKYPTSEIVALDIDEAQIARAKKRLVSQRVRFVLGDAGQLQFPTESFDACFASYVFHHMPCFPIALREIHRVLQPGASLYVLELSIRRGIPRVLIEEERPGEVTSPEDTITGFFTRSKLLREIERSGFKVGDCKGILQVYLRCERA